MFKSLILTAVTIALCASMAFPNVGTYNYANLVISYNSASHKYVVETVELINDINKAYSIGKINKEKRAEMMEHVIGLLVERDNVVIAERNL